MPVLELNPDTSSHITYFRREDWCSFVMATLLVFVGYWFSLAESVGLGFSGIFSVGANYLGVPHPPGYPIWTLYGWLFTKLLPFSTIAWRLAISSAVAGALTCGVIALMTCRSSATLLAGTRGLRSLAPRDGCWLRMGAGVAAGMTFGFDGAFWRKAVVVDVWPLSMLLFALTLCLLMCWAHQPGRKRFLVAACFVFGLAITNSQALIPAGLGLLLFVVLADQHTGRDAALIASGLLILWGLAGSWDFLPGHELAHRCSSNDKTRLILRALNDLTLAGYVGLAMCTRQWLPNWKILLATAAFFTGLGCYLLVPIFSMTNPPMNWGYPRNLEGFFHVLQRGQYEAVSPVSDFCVYLRQLWEFGRSTLKNFGLLPATLALLPIGFLIRFSPEMRRLTLGYLAVFISTSLLVVAMLNSPPDPQSTELIASYYTPLHLVLAILLGYGLVLLGTLFLRQLGAARIFRFPT